MWCETLQALRARRGKFDHGCAVSHPVKLIRAPLQRFCAFNVVEFPLRRLVGVGVEQAANAMRGLTLVAPVNVKIVVA